MHLEGFWLGVASALPVYLLLDRMILPYFVDEWERLRTFRARHRGR